MKNLIFVFSILYIPSISYAADLNLFPGNYVKLKGTDLGSFPGSDMTCPQRIRVSRVGNDIITTGGSKAFNNWLSFVKIGQGPFGCSNGGNPFANQCFRNRLQANALFSEYGDKGVVTVGLFKVRSFYRMVKDRGTGKLELAKFPDASNSRPSARCLYEINY